MQLTYDKAPLEVGSLHSSLWVPVLLGAFYSVLGPLFVLLDGLALRTPDGSNGLPWVQRWAADSTVAAVERASVPYALLVLGVVALLHQISSMLYAAGAQHGYLCMSCCPCIRGCGGHNALATLQVCPTARLLRCWLRLPRSTGRHLTGRRRACCSQQSAVWAHLLASWSSWQYSGCGTMTSQVCLACMHTRYSSICPACRLNSPLSRRSACCWRGPAVLGCPLLLLLHTLALYSLADAVETVVISHLSGHVVAHTRIA